jgi:type III restriction enzyme
VHETDTGRAKSDDAQWMRFTLDTVGKTEWPKDRQGRPLSPEGFEKLAQKRGAAFHPPGRDVRCIVSVGMLTEGWDCNTVTHIVGLRPFMSQLLCEQVVGRGLRRRTYEVRENGLMTEEVAKVFGVPFQVIPFKANPDAAPAAVRTRHHVYALPGRAHLEIRFPRVDGYRQAVRNRVAVKWETVAPLFLDPMKIPPEVEMKASLPTNTGRPALTGPGKLERVDLNPFRRGRREQELIFEMARDLTRSYVSSPGCEAPAHVLFPQIAAIVRRYVAEKVKPVRPSERLDLFLSPYYGWAIERLSEAIQPDTAQGEAAEVPRYEANREPGSTADVDYWTTKDVRDVLRSHLNYVVADTRVWEQSAAYILDTHNAVESFVKNAGLGFAIPYLHNGEPHDYVPDFIVRLKTNPVVHLILETKGFDELADVKAAAAERWVAAVNADGQFGTWSYSMIRNVPDAAAALDAVVAASPVSGATT